MKHIFRITVLLIFWVFISFCGSGPRPLAPADYVTDINTWRKQRLRSLKAPDGWLSLIGLFWLTEGDHTMGAAPDNDLVVESPGIPDRLGIFRYHDGRVKFIAASDTNITHAEQRVLQVTMTDDRQGSPTLLKYNQTTWHLIRRSSRIGVRVRQLNHPRIKQLKEIPVFPPDIRWRVPARFQPFVPSRSYKIISAAGTVEDTLSPGRLHFSLLGKSLHLVVFPGGPAHYFLVFSDLTSGKQSYGGGRFLLIPRAGADGTTFIDFNKAFNPPCVFTEHATCPMPIEENRLPVAVPAGEKVPDIYH